GPGNDRPGLLRGGGELAEDATDAVRVDEVGDGGRHVRMAHLRLTEEQFAELGARLEALADEYRELSDPSLPDASLVFALFHPAPREQAEGGTK
ncbi:hypothetical protein ABZ063_31975, partial [Streptomyces sp. NPDC006333]